MAKRKVIARGEKRKRWPLTLEEMLAELDEGPPQELYNAIYASIYGSGKRNNSYGYYITNSNMSATKETIKVPVCDH